MTILTVFSSEKLALLSNQRKSYKGRQHETLCKALIVTILSVCTQLLSVTEAKLILKIIHYNAILFKSPVGK